MIKIMSKKTGCMKHLLHNLLIIAAILLGLTACQNSTKEQLVGTWRYVKSMTVDGGELSLDGVETKNQDGTYSDEVSATCTIDTEIDGVNVQLKMDIRMKTGGEWSLNDKEIVYAPTSCGIKVTSLKSYDPSDGSFIGELTGNDLAEFSNGFVQEVKTDMLEASTERILMLQENKYVTEETDDDGKKITITCNRLK